MFNRAKYEVDEFFRPYLLCSENIRKEDEKFLSEIFSLIKLPPFGALQTPVASHADMLVCPAGDSLAVHKDYLAENIALFDKIKTLPVSAPVGKMYPDDIILNGLFLSENLYGRTDKLANELKSAAKECISVSQGYTRCSVCKINENAVITADKGLTKVFRERNVDVCLIEPKNIILEGYDYGFIGGASLTHGEGIYFFGKIEEHPSYSIMKEFAAKYGKTLISTSDLPLCDIGGGVIL